jgi:hypothetical protein
LVEAKEPSGVAAMAMTWCAAGPFRSNLHFNTTLKAGPRAGPLNHHYVKRESPQKGRLNLKSTGGEANTSPHELLFNPKM